MLYRIAIYVYIHYIYILYIIILLYIHIYKSYIEKFVWKNMICMYIYVHI